MKKIFISAAFGLALSSTSALACTDTDGDLVCDELDNCERVMNPSQLDTNDDMLGDACAHPTAIIYPEDEIPLKKWLIWAGENTRIKNVDFNSFVVIGAGSYIQGREDEDVVSTTGSRPLFIGKNTRIYGSEIQGRDIGNDVIVAAGSFIGQNTKIGNGVLVRENSYIGTGTIVGDRVEIRRNVSISGGQAGVRIGADTIIRRGTSINAYDVIIGERVKIGRTNSIEPRSNGTYSNGITFGSYSKIGDDVSIAEDVKIGATSYILPGTYVPAGTIIKPNSVYPPNE